MQGLRIERPRHARDSVLRVSGQVDLCTSSLLVEKLEGLSAGPERIGLDLSGVDSIDADSVMILAAIWNRLRQGGRRLDIVDASAQVRGVFAELGLASLLARSDGA